MKLSSVKFVIWKKGLSHFWWDTAFDLDQNLEWIKKTNKIFTTEQNIIEYIYTLYTPSSKLLNVN